MTGLGSAHGANHPVPGDKMTDGKVIFAHIPKTAGTSILSILQNTFSDAAVKRIHTETDSYHAALDQLLSGSDDSIKCIVGHIPIFDLPERGHDFAIFTVLRDPIERVLSLFRFFSAFSEEELRLRGLKKGFSLRTFLTHDFPEVFGQVSNGMVRFLSKNKDIFDPDSIRFRLLSLDDEYQQAQSQLKQIDFGITERMASTLLLLQVRWNIPFKMHEYVENTTDVESVQISDDDKELLVSLNKHDIMLYDWACLEFASRMSQLSNSPTDAWNKNAVWSPISGERVLVGYIPGRVGFYEFEKDNISWLRKGDDSKIHFLTTALSVKILLTLHSVSKDYDVDGILLKINETPLRCTVIKKNNQWWEIETDPFINNFDFGILSIKCPHFVSIRSLHSDSRDRRTLAVAIHDVCLLDDTMTLRT